MKVAIVGYRSYTNYEQFKVWFGEIIHEFKIAPSVIISGGATGIDTLAAQYASENKLGLVEFKPEYKSKKDFGAPLRRNTKIVDAADVVVAFPSQKSRGTFDTITKAEKAKKQVIIKYVD